MNIPLRVHVLVSTLVVGGAEQLLRDLLLHLDPKVVTTKLLCFKSPGPMGDELVQQGVPTQVDIMPGKMNPLVILTLKRIFQNDGCDLLLLINHRNSLMFGVPAAKLAGIPVVNWHNETFKRYSFSGLTRFGRRMAHLGVDSLVAAAKGHLDYVRDVEGLPSKDYRVIYNGVSPERASSKLDRAEARQRLGLSPEDRVIAQVAALRPDKAHEIMLDAMALLVPRIPHARLLMLGDGPRRQELEQRVKDLGLQDNCRFMGVVREVGDVLAASDLMALSSRPQMETLSVAAIEAMFAKKPVVSPDVGFMKEIVISGETGELVPPEDPKALSDAFFKLLNDDGLRETMGENAARLVEKHCHIQVMAKQFEELFLELASRSKRKGR